MSPKLRKLDADCESDGGGDASIGCALACAQRKQERKCDANRQHTRRKTKRNEVRQEKKMDMILSVHHQHLHPFSVEEDEHDPISSLSALTSDCC